MPRLKAKSVPHVCSTRYSSTRHAQRAFKHLPELGNRECLRRLERRRVDARLFIPRDREQRRFCSPARSQSVAWQLATPRVRLSVANALLALGDASFVK